MDKQVKRNIKIFREFPKYILKRAFYKKKLVNAGMKHRRRMKSLPKHFNKMNIYQLLNPI